MLTSNDISAKNPFCNELPEDSMKNDYALQLNQFLASKNIAGLINFLSDHGDCTCRCFKRQGEAGGHSIEMEQIISKVIGKPWETQLPRDQMITDLAIQCALIDPKTTAKMFSKIPFFYLQSGEAIGMICAIKDPSATLKYKDNFKTGLTRTNLNGFIHYHQIILKAEHLNSLSLIDRQQAEKQLLSELVARKSSDLT